MNEEMRKEFEEWYEREGKTKPFTTVSIKEKMFESWKASLEAMKPIKLPKLMKNTQEQSCYYYNDAIEECKEAIQQSGYKVAE
jgi:hypothetical protein